MNFYWTVLSINDCYDTEMLMTPILHLVCVQKMGIRVQKLGMGVMCANVFVGVLSGNKT